LRGAPGRETPLNKSPQARALFRRIEKERSTVAGQANRFRSGDVCPYTSQHVLLGEVNVTDKNLIPDDRSMNGRDAVSFLLQGSL
jgi:hypothetical protein